MNLLIMLSFQILNQGFKISIGKSKLKIIILGRDILSESLVTDKKK